MARVTRTLSLNAAAADVWARIGSFQGLAEWHPVVETCTAESGGEVRRLGIGGGAEIVERLESHDDNAMSYSYVIVEGPLPVANYRSTLRVRDNGDGISTVEWSGDFDAAGVADADADEAIAGVYQAGLDSLRAEFA